VNKFKEHKEILDNNKETIFEMPEK